MDLSEIKDENIRFHVRRILFYSKKDWREVWESQYDSRHYKHPLTDKIAEALESLDIHITRRKFNLPTE